MVNTGGQIPVFPLPSAYIIRKNHSFLSGYISSNGGPGRNRTNDTRIFSPLLYRLSYGTIWLRGKDLNQRPPGYEPDELPGCSTPRCLMSDSVFTYLNNVMAEELGFEPRRQFPDLPVFKTGPFNHLGIPPKYSFILVDPVGLEPTTDRL